MALVSLPISATHNHSVPSMDLRNFKCEGRDLTPRRVSQRKFLRRSVPTLVSGLLQVLVHYTPRALALFTFATVYTNRGTNAYRVPQELVVRTTRSLASRVTVGTVSISERSAQAMCIKHLELCTTSTPLKSRDWRHRKKRKKFGKQNLSLTWQSIGIVPESTVKKKSSS